MKKSFGLLLLLFWSVMLFTACGKQTVTETATVQEEGSRTDTSSGETDGSGGEEPFVWEIPSAGLRFEAPEAYVKAAGLITWRGGKELHYGDGVICTDFVYIPRTLEEYQSYFRKLVHTDREETELSQSTGVLFRVFGINGGRGAEELKTYLTEHGVPFKVIYTAGSAGDYRFFYTTGQEPEDPLLLNRYYTEFYRLLYASPDYLAEMEFQPPVTEAPQVNGVTFTTTDLDGREVTAEELFGAHGLTLVYVFTSVSEESVACLPQLFGMTEELSAKDIGVVGILADSFDEGVTEQARKGFLADVPFPVLTPPENLSSVFPGAAYPTAYFVNRNGTVYAGPLVGGGVEQYRAVIDAFLQEEAAKDLPAG